MKCVNMRLKNINKYIAFASFIIFLILSISPSISAIINNTEFLDIFSNKSKILKIDSNGRILPINLEIRVEEENNIGLTVEQELDTLLKNDKELQNFLKTNNVLPWVEVESKGYGIHSSLRRVFWSNRNLLWRSLIKYRFYNDSDCTKGRFKGTEEWINITGRQNIRLVGFIGYVSFKPNFFLSRFKTHEIIIHGYTLRIDKLK